MYVCMSVTSKSLDVVKKKKERLVWTPLFVCPSVTLYEHLKHYKAFYKISYETLVQKLSTNCDICLYLTP